MKKHPRREALKTLGLGAVSAMGFHVHPSCPLRVEDEKKHFVTLSFDDGFKKSSILTAEIFEKHNLAACINVIATAHLPGFKLPSEYHNWPVGDFGLWNELKQRGHEIMMHCYKHANLTQLSFEEGKDQIMRCIDFFSKELKGFDPRESVYNFPFNASTPELENWLPTQVKAYRTGGPAINRLPHRGQVKLTCTSFGPANIDKHLDAQINDLLSRPSGWLIYNTHGINEEGWGPVSYDYLDRLLTRLKSIDTVAVIPAGKALAK